MNCYQPRSWRIDREALASGSVSLTKIAEEICDRIDAVEPGIFALIPEENRRERLLEDARKLEHIYKTSPSAVPLFGLVVGVKDIFIADGFETRAGSKLPSELFRGTEAPSVTALKNAGALILGKTVTTEFAYFSPGPTRNPNDTERTPGGSSSGSAAAVAAGYCHAGLGTQTIGSIGRPAAFCGVAGFKPSYDYVSRAGVIPFSETLDHVGLLGIDTSVLVETIPALLETGAGGTSRDRGVSKISLEKAQTRDIKERPSLVIPYGPYLDQTEASAMIAFNMTIARLEDAGYTVRKLDVLLDIVDINERHRRIAAAEMALAHSTWYKNYKALYSPKTVELIEWGMTISRETLEADKQGCLKLRTELASSLEEAGGGLWISPATLNCAPRGIDSTGSPIMNLPWTHAGLPTLVIPSGRSLEGMPLGLQISGRFGEDVYVLQAGIGLEKVLDFSRVY